MDLEDVGAPLEVGQPELDLPVEAAGPQESGVEGVGAVGGHQHLDVAPRIETVELQCAVRKTFYINDSFFYSAIRLVWNWDYVLLPYKVSSMGLGNTLLHSATIFSGRYDNQS